MNNKIWRVEVLKVKPFCFLNDIYENYSLYEKFAKFNSKNRKDLLCVSDYSGGDGKGDNYNVHTFLFTDLMEGLNFVGRTVQFRVKNPELGKRKFEFKKLCGTDEIRKRLFPEYLELASEIEGVMVTFLIEKKLSFFGKPLTDNDIATKMKQIGFGDWKPKIVRKLFETVLIKTFLLSKISNNVKKFIWLSDRDSRIGDNEEQKNSSYNLIKQLYQVFELNFSTDFRLQKGNLPDEELNSIVDLACGFILEKVNNKNINNTYFDWYCRKDKALITKYYQLDQIGDEISIKTNE